jgi:hypothetical protein
MIDQGDYLLKLALVLLIEGTDIDAVNVQKCPELAHFSFLRCAASAAGIPGEVVILLLIWISLKRGLEAWHTDLALGIIIASNIVGKFRHIMSNHDSFLGCALAALTLSPIDITAWEY